MFSKEIELIKGLMKTYKDIRIKYELELHHWLEGDYKNLVPRIFLQMRAMRNFVSYLQFALENDLYPNKSRVIGYETMFETNDEECEEYRPRFSTMSFMILHHLIEEVGKFSVDRYNLRDEIWEEADYWNFKSLESLMGTICLICEEELSDPLIIYDEPECEENEEVAVECPWMYGDYDELYDDLTPQLALPRWVTISELDSSPWVEGLCRPPFMD